MPDSNLARLFEGKTIRSATVRTDQLRQQTFPGNDLEVVESITLTFDDGNKLTIAAGQQSDGVGHSVGSLIVQ